MAKMHAGAFSGCWIVGTGVGAVRLLGENFCQSRTVLTIVGTGVGAVRFLGANFRQGQIDLTIVGENRVLSLALVKLTYGLLHHFCLGLNLSI